MGRSGRRLWYVFVLLCLVSALCWARYDFYQMDGDSVSFMDMADGLLSHRSWMALNSYWNPLYPVLLAAAQLVAHPSRWNELQVYAYLNALIFAACLAAIVYLVNGLVRLQAQVNGGGPDAPAMSPLALRLAAVGLLLFSFQRELRIGFMRSDTLLLCLFLVAAGVLVRLQTDSRIWRYALLGFVLGLAYLTKSFAFLPSAFLFIGMLVFGFTRSGRVRRSVVTGTVLSGTVFLLVAGPYIAAISRQMGHFTTGESARLNYAFFVDEMPRWHEWAHHDLGHAGGTFIHPEIMILESPPVFSFRNHPVGTFPLWFDPAYFTAGLKPKIWLPGHLKRVIRCLQLLALWLANHPEGILLLTVLLGSGATLRRSWRECLPWLVLPGWGLLMLAIYFPIDLQERYLTTMLVLICVPILAMLRQSKQSVDHRVATVAATLLALIALTSSFREIFGVRRQLHLQGRSTGLYSSETFGAAAGLAQMGVKPGDAVACMGTLACVYDPYWARLAGVQILAEVEVPVEIRADVAWNGFQNKQPILDALRSQDLHILVAEIPEAAQIPDGWQQLGGSRYFAYPIP